jgi:hypothetical protein
MHGERRHRPFIIATGVVAILLPIVAEVLHLIPPAHIFDPNGSGIFIQARVIALRRAHILTILAILHVMMVVTPSILVGRMRDILLRSERRQVLQAWQLHQVVTGGSMTATSSTQPPLSEVAHKRR